MFEKWAERRALKRTQENKRKALENKQEDCFHEYHVVSTYEVDIREWHYSPERLVTRHDMYCPICDKTIYSMSDINAKRALEKQKVRDEYKESY